MSEYLDIFDPTEYEIDFSQSIPTNKPIRFMFGSFDSDFYDEYKKYGDCLFFSNYFLYHTFTNFNISKLENKISYNFKKLFLCLNYRPTNHRRIMMKILDESNLLNSGYYSWTNPMNNPKSTFIYDGDDVIWKNETEFFFLDSEKNDKPFKIQNYDTPPLEFYNSFLDIINETTTYPLFLTEKTWIPIIFGKVFVINGGKYIHKKLKEMGFLLYDEIFDYSFDDIDDDTLRIQKIVENVDSLKDKDYNYLYSLVKEKIKYNQKLCIDMVRTRYGIPTIETEDKHLTFCKKIPNTVDLDLFIKKFVY